MSNQNDTHRKICLRDGRTVYIRNVQKLDTAFFMRFFEDMSAKSRDFMHGFHFTRENAQAITENPDDKNCYRVVAVVQEPLGERILGYSWINPVKGDYPFIGIGIVDEFQNVGLGKTLLQSITEDAREQLKLKRLWLGVWADNPRAIRAYTAVGFREDPKKPPKNFEGRPGTIHGN